MGVRSSCFYVPANPTKVKLSMREQLDMLLRIVFSCDKSPWYLFTFGRDRYANLMDELHEDTTVTLRVPLIDEVRRCAESERWTYIDVMLGPDHELFRTIEGVWRSSNDLFGYTPLSIGITIGDIIVYHNTGDEIYNTCLSLDCSFDGSFDNAETAIHALESSSLLTPVIAAFNPEYQDHKWRVLYNV